VKSALATLDAFEQEHRRADSLHARVDMFGKRCLEEGTLSQSQARQFRDGVADLVSIYKEHIRIEDHLVFRIAARILSEADKAMIVAEMRLAESDLPSCAARLSVLIRESPSNWYCETAF
jgi:hemerythrin-like domain-containing protein